VAHSDCTSEIFRIGSTENTSKTFISRILVFSCFFFFQICSSFPVFILSLPFFRAFAVLRSVPSNRSCLYAYTTPTAPEGILIKSDIAEFYKTLRATSVLYNENIKYNEHSTSAPPNSVDLPVITTNGTALVIAICAEQKELLVASGMY